MPVGVIRWGVSSSATTPHYENELTLGYTPFDWLTDRPPRDGSEWVQGPSGVEDAWVTGRDYLLDAEFRFIPDKPVSSSAATPEFPQRSVVAGPLSWQAFLDYCRDKNDFRFVPNANVPDFYVEKCYLVDPLRGFGGNLEDLTRGVRLVLRSTSMDFTQAMRGVAFEYAPGAQISGLSTGATFTRSGSAYYIQAASTSKQGQTLQTAGSGIIRDLHRLSSGVRATLLDQNSTNDLLSSVALDNANWTLLGATVTANDRAAPDATGSTTADRLVASTSSGIHYASQNTTATFDAASLQGMLGHFRADGYDQVLFYMEAGAGNRIGATVDLTAGTVASFTEGVGVLRAGPLIRALDDSWYEIRLAGVLDSSSTTGQYYLRLLSTAGAASFAGATSGAGIHGWGFQWERASAPTAFIPTSSAAANRAAEAWRVDWPWKPQAGWHYIKFQELGTLDRSLVPMLEHNNTANASPLATLRQGSTSTYNWRINKTVAISATVSVTSTAAYGDVVELLATISTDGALSLRQAVNGGTESGSTSAALSGGLPSTWSGSLLWFTGAPSSTNVAAYALISVKSGFSTGVTTIAAARSA